MTERRPHHHYTTRRGTRRPLPPPPPKSRLVLYAIAGLGVLAGLLIAAGSAAFVVLAYLDPITKFRLEQAATEAAGTPVTIGEVSVSPFSGAGRLSRLAVANPAGYSEASALRIDEVRVKLAPLSLLFGPIVVHEIVVEAPLVNWELGAAGGNLGKLRRATRRVEDDEDDLPRTTKPPARDPEARRIIIENFITHKGRVRVDPRFGGRVDVELPDLHLRGLGAKEGGATVHDALSQAFHEVARSAWDAGGGARRAVRSISDVVAEAYEKHYRKRGKQRPWLPR